MDPAKFVPTLTHPIQHSVAYRSEGLKVKCVCDTITQTSTKVVMSVIVPSIDHTIHSGDQSENSQVEETGALQNHHRPWNR